MTLLPSTGWKCEINHIFPLGICLEISAWLIISVCFFNRGMDDDFIPVDMVGFIRWKFLRHRIVLTYPLALETKKNLGI